MDLHARPKGRFFVLAITTLLIQFSFRFIIAILIFFTVLAAGCMQATAPAAPATPVPVTGSGLQHFALGPSDVPACFSLTSQHVKTSGEVGRLAKDLGWEAGYEVTYTCPVEGAEPTVFVHSLAVYPAVNIPGIAAMVYEQDRSAGFTYEDLPFPEQGSTVRGFYGRAGGAEVSGDPAGTGLLSPGDDVSGTDAAEGSDRAEVIMGKGTNLGVLKMTGPGTNATVIRDLALVALAKMP